jgi:hypothetical protein
VAHAAFCVIFCEPASLSLLGYLNEPWKAATSVSASCLRVVGACVGNKTARVISSCNQGMQVTL